MLVLFWGGGGGVKGRESAKNPGRNLRIFKGWELPEAHSLLQGGKLVRIGTHCAYKRICRREQTRHLHRQFPWYSPAAGPRTLRITCSLNCKAQPADHSKIP